MILNELRIGNFIKISNTITKVEGFSEWDNIVQSSNFAERKINEFEPIPITEELLIKFGFNEYVNTNIYPIKYVHQLQNLYFALIGEELIINTKTI